MNMNKIPKNSRCRGLTLTELSFGQRSPNGLEAHLFHFTSIFIKKFRASLAVSGV